MTAFLNHSDRMCTKTVSGDSYYNRNAQKMEPVLLNELIKVQIRDRIGIHD